MFKGPLSQGVVLIVKSCGTNISANVNSNTTKLSIKTLWLWEYWKVVPDLQSDPRGALGRPHVGPTGIASRLI